VKREKGVGALYEKLQLSKIRHFNAFSGTQLIFSQAGTSAAFLWVPFLSPPKEMEQKFARLKWIIPIFLYRVSIISYICEINMHYEKITDMYNFVSPVHIVLYNMDNGRKL